MAGRGRGRGRGSNPLFDFYEANREAVGDLNNEAPATWPEIAGGIPALSAMSQADVQLIKTMRRHEKRVRESPYYMSDGATRAPQMSRWSTRHQGAADTSEEKLSAALATSRPLVPPELFGAGSGSSAAKKAKKGAALSAKELEALEKIEQSALSRGAAGAGEAVGAYEEGDDDGGEASDADQDYVENHYASENEDDGGDDDGGAGDYY